VTTSDELLRAYLLARARYRNASDKYWGHWSEGDPLPS
jgi:hypothetical protein